MSAIRSFGAYLPERILTNRELSARLGVAEAWIHSATGILERRVAADFETTTSMGVHAALACLARAGMDPRNVGLMLMSSGTGELRFPGPASTTAHRLGIGGVPAIDLPLASAGSLFALALASDLTARFGNVLVVAAEKLSGPGLAEPLSRDIAPLFGDGAGACLMTLDDTGLVIRGHVLHSDGAFASLLQLELTGPVMMDGLRVILHSARKIPAVISELLRRHAVDAESITAFLMHQANQNLIDRVAAAVGVPPARFPSNIARYGNTSSASLLIAAAEYFETRAPHDGETFCFAAFGAGLHWGALLAASDGSII